MSIIHFATRIAARRWVSKGVALRAVRFFIETSGRKPDVDWEFDFPDVGGVPARD